MRGKMRQRLEGRTGWQAGQGSLERKGWVAYKGDVQTRACICSCYFCPEALVMVVVAKERVIRHVCSVSASCFPARPSVRRREKVALV